MNKSVIEVTPKTIFGYAIFCVGLFLLVYVAFTCFMLANGTMEPLKIEIEGNLMSEETTVLLGIFVQIGMYGILMFASSILMRVGLSLLRT